MAWLHFSISFHSGWFLVLVMCSGLHIRQNWQHLTFFVGLFEK
jgi:hypothetical protein